MIYVKSLLAGVAGVAALLVAAILCFCIYVVLFGPKTPPGTTVGWDVRIFTAQPLFWLTLLLAFATAFYWEFRRASR
jgi:hypothetical protein